MYLNFFLVFSLILILCPGHSTILPPYKKSIFGHMLFVETGHKDRFQCSEVPEYWFLTILQAGHDDLR